MRFRRPSPSWPARLLLRLLAPQRADCVRDDRKDAAVQPAPFLPWKGPRLTRLAAAALRSRAAPKRRVGGVERRAPSLRLAVVEATPGFSFDLCSQGAAHGNLMTRVRMDVSPLTVIARRADIEAGGRSRHGPLGSTYAWPLPQSEPRARVWRMAYRVTG